MRRSPSRSSQEKKKRMLLRSPKAAGSVRGRFKQSRKKHTGRAKRSLFDLSSPLFLPKAYGIVEKGIYRSAMLEESSLSFLSNLKLKCVLNLSVEQCPAAVMNFLLSNNINLVAVGLKTWQPSSSSSSWEPFNLELVTEAIEILLDPASRPCLIMCSSGYSVTGVVVGCFRKVRHWTLSSIVDEYRRFAGQTANVYNALQFIENFDTDIISMVDTISTTTTTKMIATNSKTAAATTDNDNKNDTTRKAETKETIDKVSDWVNSIILGSDFPSIIPLTGPGVKYTRKRP